MIGTLHFKLNRKRLALLLQKQDLVFNGLRFYQAEIYYSFN